MRWHHGDRQMVTDSVLFGLWNMLLARADLNNAVSKKLEELDITLAAGSWILISRLAIPLALLAYFPRWRAYRKSTESATLAEGESTWTSQYPKARIFPCQTKHARMFPKHHAFEYSYLQCGFPIVPAVIGADGVEVGGSNDVQLGRWWLRVKAADYLNRGNGELGFYNKLKLWLREQVWHNRIPPHGYFPLNAYCCRKLMMPNGLMPTSSRHQASLAILSTPFRSGTSTIQIISSPG